jgi:hypothetical protein
MDSIYFEYDDDDGINPSEIPFVFSFEVYFDYTHAFKGNREQPPEGSDVEVTKVKLIGISKDGKLLTNHECISLFSKHPMAEFEEWFYNFLPLSGSWDNFCNEVDEYMLDESII